MLLIQSVLDKDDLAEVTGRLKTLAMQPGKSTADTSGRKAAPNPQTHHDDPRTRALTGWLKTVVSRHPLVQAYAQPLRFSNLILSRHAPDEPHGLHADEAIMGADDGNRLRADLAFTLFLSPKDGYDGGALSLEATDGTRDVRLDAGDMVIHRAGMLHQVLPVTRGERLTCTGWIQSLTPRDDEREVLFDLHRLVATSQDNVQKLMAQKTLGNLLRMWAKT
jgi:PKHD-type hydroxylase